MAYDDMDFRPCRFYDSNQVALEHMRRLAEGEVLP